MLATLLTFAATAGHHAADLILIAICALVGAYLFAALLWPEKF